MYLLRVSADLPLVLFFFFAPLFEFDLTSAHVFNHIFPKKLSALAFGFHFFPLLNLHGADQLVNFFLFLGVLFDGF